MVKDCVFVRSNGWGMSVRFSKNLQFENNFWVDSLKFGVYMKNNENLLFRNNNIMGVRMRSWVTSLVEYDLAICFFYDD